MVRKKTNNLDRFSGSVAKLVGGKPLKKTTQKVKKTRFQLDRKKQRKLKKVAKKEKKISHILLKAGASLPEHSTELPNSKARVVSKKTIQGNLKNKNSKDMISLQSKLKKIYDQSTGKSIMTKEEAAIANKQEDKLMKHLGKRLGFSGKANTPKSLDIDGLGYVLHFKDECKDLSEQETMSDSATNELFNALEPKDCDFSDDFDDDDLSNDEIMSNDDESSSIQDITDNTHLEEMSNDSICDEDNLTNEVSSDDEISLDDELSPSCDEQVKTSNSIVDVVSEDDKIATVTPLAYVPPHLRNMDSNEMLKRKIRGYVNRVSTSNFKQILNDIELVYQDYPRAEVNKEILCVVTDSCLISSVMPSRLCAEIMLLIAGLSSTIGPEFVSPMLEDLANKFANEMTQRHGKLLNNIVTMICFLYALKVVSCVLIFDIIDHLLKSFTEADLEVLLYIFKSVGLDIRKDDPQALKDIVQIVNESVNNVKEKSSRFIWFVDTLSAVKNNNVNKIPNYDKSDIIDIQRAYKAVVKSSPNNLQLKLTDLLDAKTKGRWWLVGAAWAGVEDTKKSSAVEFDNKLLVLAKKNHMNTDVRRNVFCILMSSQDYEHCYGQMIKLNLKDKEEREIIHVTVLCALKCKTFNPYYTNVISKFCGLSKNFQITTQFSLWDRLKELDSLTSNKASNLSMLLSSLICSKTLSLSVLKVVNFSEIGNKDVEFFKELFRKMLNEPEIVITEVFGRLQPLPLESLKNGIKVFMKHFLKPELTPIEQKNMKIACKCF